MSTPTPANSQPGHSPRTIQILVTAGPTREYIDDVRYLSNRSSGRMGIAIARAFVAAAPIDCDVTIIAGPCEVPLPHGEPRITVVQVTSATDMRDAVADRFAACDVFVAAAAVADFRPVSRYPGKKKKDSATPEAGWTIDLVPNPDILAEMGAQRRPDQLVVGFALEVSPPGEPDQPLAHAVGKRNRKGADWIVLNSPANFGDGRDAIHLVGPDAVTGEVGLVATIDEPTKEATAASLVRWLLEHWPNPVGRSESSG